MNEKLKESNLSLTIETTDEGSLISLKKGEPGAENHVIFSTLAHGPEVWNQIVDFCEEHGVEGYRELHASLRNILNVVQEKAA